MSKYIRGMVISDEKPKTVLEALEENWILRGPGKIWLLLKNVYGTNDGVRSFFLSMNETKLGGKQVTGDKALCTFHSEKRRLMGLIGLHVDNL